MIIIRVKVAWRPWLLLLLTGSILLSSYASFLQAQQIKFVKYTAEDGLPSSNIYQIIQDKAGFIWIGTDKGVSRFDGYNFKNFTLQDGLPNNDVWGLKEDASGRIWFATFNQLAYYDNGIIHKIPFTQHRHFKNPMVIANWISDEAELYVYVKEKKTNFLLQINVLNQTQKITATNFDHFGFLRKEGKQEWFYSLRRHKQPCIELMQEGKPVNYLNLEMDESHLLSRKFIKGKEQIYFFTPTSIIQYNFRELQTISVASTFGKGVIIEDVFPGNSQYQQLILLKTNLGYKILDKDLKPLNLLNPSDVFYKSILKDRNGNIWLAAADGLYLLTANARFSQFYALSEDGKSNKCTALYIEDDKTIWAGNQKNEVWKIKGTTKTYTTLKQNDYTNVPITHLSKWHNQLVAAGDFGVFLLPIKNLHQPIIKAQTLKRKTNELYEFQASSGNFLPYPIKAITRSDHCLLLSQWNGVDYLCQENDIITKTNLESNRTYISVSDKKGIIWMGKKDGLWFLEKDKLIHAGSLHPFLNYPINDLKIDRNGRLWLATDGYGVLCFDGQSVVEITESKNCIPQQLYIDEHNQLWVATNRGVSRIKLKSTTPYSYEYQQITTAHGLASSEVNQVIIKDSIIYAATNGGLTVIDYKKDFSVLSPTLSVEKVLINGQAVNLSGKYDLSYLENSLKIQYVCLSYESRKQISYQYQMSNIDTTWQNTSSLVREYQKLIPGNYTFRLKAVDIDGNLSEEQAITFIIHPPWWETIWFKFLISFLFLALVITIFQIRVRTIKRREVAKTKINKKFAALELQALQAQMNPHFIFNSMNAIQNFIYTKEKRAAGKYIVKFSRLMRLFLNASNQKYGTLEQEIEILQKYVELENLRFEEKFRYQFEIDANLPLATTKILSLLLQPYVENAINHGLVHRATKGNLWIRFKKIKENSLLCEIEDNGIGRAKAMEIRQNSFKKHKPRGMALVEERQKIMNFMEEQDIQINIIDLKN